MGEDLKQLATYREEHRDRQYSKDVRASIDRGSLNCEEAERQKSGDVQDDIPCVVVGTEEGCPVHPKLPRLRVSYEIRPR